LWHTEPVTAFPVHRTHEGFGRGYPWSLAPGCGEVKPAEYPRATELESSLIVCDEMHPITIQPLELMEALEQSAGPPLPRRDRPTGSAAPRGAHASHERSRRLAKATTAR